jgi:hypothetical protein
MVTDDTRRQKFMTLNANWWMGAVRSQQRKLSIQSATPEPERAGKGTLSVGQRRSADQRWTVPFPPAPAVAPPADGLLATDWSGCTDSDGSDDEALTAHPTSMRPPRLRPPRVPSGVALRVAYWMLWRPETDGSRRGMDTVKDFCAQADAAMRALADGHPRARVPPRVLLAEWKEPWALGRVWDCREAGELGAQVVAVAEGIDDGGALGVALDGGQSDRLLALS